MMRPHEGCGCCRTAVRPSRRSVLAAFACAAIAVAVARGSGGGAQVTADDERFMRMAIEEARTADFPFGAVIVGNGQVIMRGRNLGRTTAIRPRMARWSRSAACPRQLSGRERCGHHALHLRRTLRDVHGRDPVVPHRAAGLCRLGRAARDQDRPDHDLAPRMSPQTAEFAPIAITGGVLADEAMALFK